LEPDPCLCAMAQAFHDEPCAVETPNQTRERLANYAEAVGVDRKAFLQAVKVGKGNAGTSVSRARAILFERAGCASTGLKRFPAMRKRAKLRSHDSPQVTSDLKLQIKFHRMRGIHVTPTVALE
jgi:hypothetical protein